MKGWQWEEFRVDGLSWNVSIPTEELFLDKLWNFGWGTEDGGNMLGKDFDCSPGWDNSSMITSCILEFAVFKGEWRRENQREQERLRERERKREIREILIKGTVQSKNSEPSRCPSFRRISDFRGETPHFSQNPHSLLAWLLNCGPYVHFCPCKMEFRAPFDTIFL